jgi:hypothetical protein
VFLECQNCTNGVCMCEARKPQQSLRQTEYNNGKVCTASGSKQPQPLQPVNVGDAVRRCQSDVDDCNKSESVVCNAVDAVSDADVELIKPILDLLPDFVTAEQRSRVRGLLLNYIDIFARHEYDVGHTQLAEYRLELKDPSLPPIAEAVRAHQVAYLDQIDEEVQ